MTANDFLAFANGASANVLPQAEYAALSALLASGFQAGTAQSAQVNKVWRQSSIMAAVLAQLIVDTTGQNAVDDGTTATLLANLKAAVSARSVGVVGTSRNASMSIATASVTGTFTADELIVETALGGLRYSLANVSDTFNLTTDMDTGSAPASGYVALYKLFNPSTGASVRRIVNATSITAPEVFSGANPPAGFTASALVAVVPTNASAQFAAGTNLVCRWVNRPASMALNSSVVKTSFTALNFTNIPRNARRAKIIVGTTCNAVGTTQTLDLAMDANASGQISCGAATSISGNGNNSNAIVDVGTPQTLFYRADNTPNNGTTIFSFYVTGYEF